MKPFVTLLLAVFACNLMAQTEAPKNIIMVVGDGMGPAYTTAYRYFSDDKSTDIINETVFDRHLKGMASTYPARSSGYVTDSAAGATALSSGYKSYNGAIGVNESKQAVETILERAKMRGMKTGVAVTSQINHATPAAFSSHNEYRRNYDQIADSYFDDKVNGQFVLDVMLGGGWKYFLRQDRNLVNEFKQAGYRYVDKLENLSQLSKSQPVIGLFADEGMPWALDSKDHLRLPMLTKAAISQLENDKGFFLLVEGSQVDWAGHSNDIASAMAEMHDLAMTMEYLESYVADHPDTLVVLTADHSTGGLSIAANKDYVWKPELIQKLKASPYTIALRMGQSDSPMKLAEELLGFTLTDDDKALISQVNIGDLKALYTKLKKVIDNRTNTGWTTTGHTAVDVQVFAMGQGQELFNGHIDNTEIPQTLFKLLNKP